MVDMASAAEQAVVSQENDVFKRTLKAFFNQEPQYGVLLQRKYQKISIFKNSNTPYSLYCDSSAFKFVTTYQEDEANGKKKGDKIPANEAYDGGLWYATRRKSGDPPLYIKSQKRDDYCFHPTLNKPAAGVSTKGGKHIILCPPAFENTVNLANAKGTTYPDKKPLKDFEGLSLTLFHEATHCAFSTNDDEYGPFPCLGLAARNGFKAQNNADSFSYFALATYLDKNTWFRTFSGPVPNQGSSGQSKMRRRIGGHLARLANVAIAPSTLVKRQIQPVSSVNTPKPSSRDVQEAIVAATISGVAITETFAPTTYADYRSITAPVTVSTQDAAGNPLSIIIGPSGLGWKPLDLSSGEPVLPGPTSLPLNEQLPSSAIATPGSSGSALPSEALQSSGVEPSSGAASSSIGSSAVVASPSSPSVAFPSSTVQSNSVSNSKSSGGTLLPSGPTNTGGVPVVSGTDNAPKTTNPIPSTDAADSAPLPIITNTNPVSTKSYSALPPGVTGNTIYHEKDDDGHDNPMPFLWHCFFCGGGGLSLPGFGTSPGVYPPPVPPPVPNFPTITIGKDNIPTPGSESDADDNNDDDNQSKTDDNDESKTTAAPSTNPQSGSTSHIQTSSMAITSSFASSSAPSSSASGTAESYVIEDAIFTSMEAIDSAAVEAYISSFASGPIPTGSVTSGGLTAPSSLSTGGPMTTGTGAPGAQSTATDAATSSLPAVDSSSVVPPPSTTAPPPEPTTEPAPEPTPTEPVVSPVDPPSAPTCKPAPTGHYQDAHEEVMAQAVEWFCGNNDQVVHDPTVDIEVVGHDDPFLQFLDNNDSNDDVYDMSIKSVPDCDPGEGGFNLKEPVSGFDCKDILYNSWKNCEFSPFRKFAFLPLLGG
ncbi:MAG: hypothetical protein L6R41_005806 [Letrouitia leprolyta]|nr:MAG: hypothetical protein L6R41_005806 [Letrouitia leprolyta]